MANFGAAVSTEDEKFCAEGLLKMPCMLLWLLPLLLLLCCCCFICLKLCRRRRRAKRWSEDAFLTEEMKAALNEAKEMLAAAVSAREEAQREVEELRRQHKDQGEEMIAAIETWEAALRDEEEARLWLGLGFG